jgi:hypothetical protein
VIRLHRPHDRFDSVASELAAHVLTDSPGLCSRT